MSTLRGGLIGAHISRTRLPAALEIMCAEAGWSFDWTLIDTAEAPGFDFTTTVDKARAEGWTGVTVTHPWKTHARTMAGDGMVAEVAHLGAANTLVFNEKITGYNTDYTGFLAVMGSGAVGDVTVMGAGGVAEAVVPALMSLKHPNAHVGVYDTQTDRAADLARRTGALAFTQAHLTIQCNWDHGLVNCTPLGMADYPGNAFDWLTLTNDPPKWAFDAVYTPVWTPFLTAARDAGLEILTGFDLFRHMAIRSFAAYTGLAVDAEAIFPKLAALEPR
ncbi:shikimate dehydrogenase family protein [Pseudaestuariivita sp.]|uniref:shikimate dehydrogenase family protein n=1 Tax=Pseudaestuariivita sp. TaxID=2211669 RepID=UPI004059D321